MKLAILGSGPKALESAAYFHNLGAAVRIIKSGEKWGGALKKYSSNELSQLDLAWPEIASSDGMEIAKQTKVESAQDYLNYLQNLGESFEGLGLVKKGWVKRIHKRFLPPGIKPVDRSRLADLFRVIYRVDADEQIEKQRAENSEVFEKLGKEVVESLKDSIESFEDFDLIIDARGPFTDHKFMGATGVQALNEDAIRLKQPIFYGQEISEGLEKLSENDKRITFIGNGPHILYALGKIKEKFKENHRIKLQFITDQKIPFETIKNPMYQSLLNHFKDILDFDREEFKSLIEDFEKKIVEWKSLESHIKAKTPKPAEPVSRVFVYNGAIVSSVDKLLDQEGIFLTLEGSDLIGSADQLKTLASDIIFVDSGYDQDYQSLKGLNLIGEKVGTVNEIEPGYFSLRNTDADACLIDLKDEIIKIEAEIMKYFSKA